MKTPTITIDGRTGCVFEGEIPQTFCFVPEELLIADGEHFRVAECDYIRARWDVRNMRCNDAGEGQRLFPNTRRDTVALDSPAVRTFLSRIAGAHFD